MLTTDREENFKELTISVGALRKYAQLFANREETAEIPFSAVMLALFPQAWDNINTYTKGAYTRGYIAGKKAAEHDS